MMRLMIRTTFTVCLAVATQVSNADEPAAPSGDAEILPADARLQEIWNEGEFTEGVAVAPDGSVFFSDIAFAAEGVGRVLKFDPKSGKVSVFAADSGKSNGLMFDRKGRLIAACGANNGLRAVCVVTPDGTLKPIVNRYRGRHFNSPNDLVIHPDGSIYFSDPRYVGKEPVELDLQNIFRIGTDGEVERVKTDIEKPNGLHLSPDAKTLYVAETNNGSLDVTVDDPNRKVGRMTLNAFRLHPDGSVSDKRVLVDFGEETGTDGMAVDRQGNIYAAVRSASRFGIVVFSPEGKERAYIPTPELPTNCTFGRGATARTLYVTAGGGLYQIGLNLPGYHPATASAD